MTYFSAASIFDDREVPHADPCCVESNDLWKEDSVRDHAGLFGSKHGVGGYMGVQEVLLVYSVYCVVYLLVVLNVLGTRFLSSHRLLDQIRGLGILKSIWVPCPIEQRGSVCKIRDGASIICSAED